VVALVVIERVPMLKSVAEAKRVMTPSISPRSPFATVPLQALTSTRVAVSTPDANVLPLTSTQAPLLGEPFGSVADA
jgi:hypothetical protein